MTSIVDDPELHPVKLSLATRNTVTIGIREKVHRLRALETRP